MTYMPPPYSAPTVTSDPTNVMGRRIVAFIIDLVLVWVILAVLFVATANKIENVPTGYCTDSQFRAERAHSCFEIGNTAYELDSGRTGSGIALYVGYWTVVGMIEGATGAFVGKRLLGLRVVNADGELAGPGRGAVRGVLTIVDSFCVFLVGLITASVTHPHRRIGDMAAGTYVVAKESVGRPIPTGAASYIPYAPPQQQQPPAATTPGGFAPGTYGTSLPPSASPRSEDQPGWGAPTPTTPGWAAPQQPQEPQPQPEAQPAPQAAPQQQPAPAPPQPQWDAARNAWIVWEPTRGQWLQWDAATSQWRPI